MHVAQYNVWTSLEPSGSAFLTVYHICTIQTDTGDTKSSMLCCQEQGIPDVVPRSE